MPTIKIEAPEFEIADEGKYVFKWLKLENDPKGVEYADTTRLDFEVMGTKSERNPGQAIQQVAFVSRPPTPTNKYGRFISATLGRDLKEDEGIDTDDLLGGFFVGSIIHEKRDKGGMRSVINDKNLQPYVPDEFSEGQKKSKPEPPVQDPEPKAGPMRESPDRAHENKALGVASLLVAKGVSFALEYTGLEKKTEIMGWLRKRSDEELDGMVSDLSDPFSGMDD